MNCKNCELYDLGIGSNNVTQQRLLDNHKNELCDFVTKSMFDGFYYLFSLREGGRQPGEMVYIPSYIIPCVVNTDDGKKKLKNIYALANDVDLGGVPKEYEQCFKLALARSMFPGSPEMRFKEIEGIGKATFEGQKTIKKIQVPESVEWVGPYAFSGCDNLMQVVFERKPIYVDDMAIENSDKFYFKRSEFEEFSASLHNNGSMQYIIISGKSRHCTIPLDQICVDGLGTKGKSVLQERLKRQGIHLI